MVETTSTEKAALGGFESKVASDGTSISNDSVVEGEKTGELTLEEGMCSLFIP